MYACKCVCAHTLTHTNIQTHVQVCAQKKKGRKKLCQRAQLTHSRSNILGQIGLVQNPALTWVISTLWIPRALTYMAIISFQGYSGPLGSECSLFSSAVFWSEVFIVLHMFCSGQAMHSDSIHVGAPAAFSPSCISERRLLLPSSVFSTFMPQSKTQNLNMQLLFLVTSFQTQSSVIAKTVS